MRKALLSNATAAEALSASQDDLARMTKTGLMQVMCRIVNEMARQETLSVTSISQLRDICLAASKIFGWDEAPSLNVAVQANTSVAVQDPERARLIAQLEASRARALAAAAPSDVPQLANASDARREEALAYEHKLKDGDAVEVRDPCHRAWPIARQRRLSRWTTIAAGGRHTTAKSSATKSIRFWTRTETLNGLEPDAIKGVFQGQITYERDLPDKMSDRLRTDFGHLTAK